MNQALDLWIRETGTTKIDMAEQSGLWKVYMNHNGFERTQTMDKYLSHDRFPKNPRWSKVYQTVEYVFSACNRNSEQRDAMKTSYADLKAMV